MARPWSRDANQQSDWTLALTSTALALVLGYTYLKAPLRKNVNERWEDDDQHHPLLKNHSETRAYTTDYATYPSIRAFYHANPHAEKLQAIADLPLLVFIHGLGGSLAQFAPLLGSLINIAPCFGIELPGHGLSGFAPKDYGAYRCEAFASLWKEAMEQVCREKGHRKVVLIGHSMGCSIAAILASTSLAYDVLGIVAICPKAEPPNKSQASAARFLLGLPDVVLDVLRYYDRRGGSESKSVKRFVGDVADVDLKRQQLKFNNQFKTAVWKRSGLGCLPIVDKDGKTHGGLPERETWRSIRAPVFLIAGEADTVTTTDDVAKITSFLQDEPIPESFDEAKSSTAIPVADTTSPSAPKNQSLASDTQHGTQTTLSTSTTHTSHPLQTVILPRPAAHALMYSHTTYRTVAGLIEDFLSTYISPQLSLGWQLQKLTTTGKWDVKNLEKWRAVLPVSGTIGPNGLFRALKTLREQDDVHSPAIFLEKWKDSIFAVVDISHDAPVYDTKALERGGVQYHKFPTVSKVPPTVVEVADFIALIDRLRSDKDKEEESSLSSPLPSGAKDQSRAKKTTKSIGVHCHYGYNRTGFFICSYLIEKEGYEVGSAIEEFKRAKPPGIRHDHFIDTLYVRYCVGLRRPSGGSSHSPGMNGSDPQHKSMTMTITGAGAGTGTGFKIGTDAAGGILGKNKDQEDGEETS